MDPFTTNNDFIGIDWMRLNLIQIRQFGFRLFFTNTVYNYSLPPQSDVGQIERER